VWTWALLGEVPTSYALAGGALIVAGTIVQSRPAPHAAVEVTPG
jgi:drug/metabolite transporter (DMT)-like permease